MLIAPPCGKGPSPPWCRGSPRRAFTPTELLGTASARAVSRTVAAGFPAHLLVIEDHTYSQRDQVPEEFGPR